jgi:hypothetical protein
MVKSVVICGAERWLLYGDDRRRINGLRWLLYGDDRRRINGLRWMQ